MMYFSFIKNTITTPSHGELIGRSWPSKLSFSFVSQKKNSHSLSPQNTYSREKKIYKLQLAREKEMASTHANAKQGYDCGAIFYASGLQLIRSFVKGKKSIHCLVYS